MSDISADMVNEYLYWLVKNGCSINTRNIRLAALLFFYHFGPC
ncbi:MAG: site-specific integrase [Dorea sp.]|nr:site-specific integrase [Dorea sp.]